MIVYYLTIWIPYGLASLFQACFSVSVLSFLICATGRIPCRLNNWVFNRVIFLDHWLPVNTSRTFFAVGQIHFSIRARLAACL